MLIECNLQKNTIPAYINAKKYEIEQITNILGMQRNPNIPYLNECRIMAKLLFMESIPEKWPEILEIFNRYGIIRSLMEISNNFITIYDLSYIDNSRVINYLIKTISFSEFSNNDNGVNENYRYYSVSDSNSNNLLKPKSAELVMYNYSLKEETNENFLSLISNALKFLKINGYLVIQLPNFVNSIILNSIYLISCLFQGTNLIRPLIGSISNNPIYIVGKNLLDIKINYDIVKKSTKMPLFGQSDIPRSFITQVINFYKSITENKIVFDANKWYEDNQLIPL
jgi:hypothetical protein